MSFFTTPSAGRAGPVQERHGDLNFQTPEFLRTLGGLTGDLLSQDGAALGPDLGRIPKLLETEKLVITSLAYIRGRCLQRVFFIVDEAQNLTPHEVKTIITRAGGDTKFVFTGDINQIDHPFQDSLSNG